MDDEQELEIDDLFVPKESLSEAEIRVAIASPWENDRRVLSFGDNQVNLGLPHLNAVDGQNKLSIPNKPHLFMVNDLRLSSLTKEKESSRSDILVLFCHGRRNGSSWMTADGQDIVDIVWQYNNWIEQHAIDLPKVGAIVSCSAAEERSASVPV